MLFTSLSYSNYLTTVASKQTPIILHPALPPPLSDADKKALASAFQLFAVFLLIDIMLFVWALMLASKCHTQNKLLHVLVALFLPLPYIIYYYGFSDCNKH